MDVKFQMRVTISLMGNLKTNEFKLLHGEKNEIMQSRKATVVFNTVFVVIDQLLFWHVSSQLL